MAPLPVGTDTEVHRCIVTADLVGDSILRQYTDWCLGRLFPGQTVGAVLRKGLAGIRCALDIGCGMYCNAGLLVSSGIGLGKLMTG